MSAMVLPKEISQALVELTGEPREGMALVLLMRDYARHKLEEIDAALKQLGMTDEQLARVHAPIGLDVGVIGRDEIALSIMAEMIAVRHGPHQIVERAWLNPSPASSWLRALLGASVAPSNCCCGAASRSSAM